MAGLRAEVTVAVKRLIRPFLPDRLVARLRKRGHSAQARVNVDVVAEDRAARRRWLTATPDTYRAVAPVFYDGRPVPSADVAASSGEEKSPAPVVGLARRDLAAEERRRLLLPLADPAVMVSVLGEAAPPRVERGRAGEPAVAPLAIAMRRPMWDEVGGPPGGSDPLPGLLDRARQAGHRLALTPLSQAGGSPYRTDPATGAGSVVILAVVPLHDVGGGSRSAQLALELAGRGYHVAYVAMYGTAESVDLGLRYLHPRLEQYRADDFDPDRLAGRVEAEQRLVIAELPHTDFLPTAAALAGHGYRVVYDLIDDWSDPALGGWWYNQDMERRLVDMADGLVASAPPLRDKLAALSGRPVVEVPNGVNARLFGGRPEPAPSDFPAGDGPVLGYHGSLYGDWFDWGALASVAAAHPTARVIVIGDERSHPAMPANVHFLGLKPQQSLPAYLSHTDVGLIPFKVNETTHAVSPLKAFEYLAMGVPVAAPPLRTLDGLAGVHVANELTDAARLALAGPRPDRRAALDAHGWGERVGRLFGSVGLVVAPEAGPPVRTIVRPAVHYPRRARHLERPPG